MSAGLRSSRQDSLIAASTRGSGRPSTRSGSSGSAPFSSLTGATGGVSRSAGRKPAAAATCGVIRSARKRWNAPRALGLLGRDPRGVEHDERVVGEERALLRVERDQLVAAGAVRVEVEQRDLLHRDRARVARALLAHLVGDEQRRVAVVDDAALDLAHRAARLRAGHLGLREPLLLARRGVVLGDDGGEPAGGEVRVGVDELERAELGPPERGPAALVAREAQDVVEPDALLRPAERARHRLPHRDHERRAHDRLVLARRDLAVGLEVEQPAPQRGRRRPDDGLEPLVRDPGLRVAGRHDLRRDVDRLAADLDALAVERLDRAARAASPSPASRRTGPPARRPPRRRRPAGARPSRPRRRRRPRPRAAPRRRRRARRRGRGGPGRASSDR